MKESKIDRFRRVAEARVNKIIKMIRLLGNCSGTSVYTHSRAVGIGFIFTHEATESHEGVVWSFFIMLFGRG